MSTATDQGSDFRLPVRVYYEDTDAGGVVYYANYLKYFERARTERLRALGFDQGVLVREWNFLFVVRSIEVQYEQPARLDDLLEVSAPVELPGRASLTFGQAIERGGEVLCRGRVRIASLDATTFRPRPMPTEILEVLR